MLAAATSNVAVRDFVLGATAVPYMRCRATSALRGVCPHSRRRGPYERSAAQDASLRPPSLSPPRALELRLVALGLRIAEAEIADEAPVVRDIEHAVHARRIEDRDPTHSDALGARREPHHGDGGHD